MYRGRSTVSRQMTVMDAKGALRRRLRDARAAAVDRVIVPPPPFLSRLAPGLVVAAYQPIRSEADPALLVAAARSHGCRIALPVVTDRDSPLRFVGWDGSPLVSGPFGLSQPAADGMEVAPDVILTPLVGFDRCGNRLGQGAGHYDRAFAGYPAAWRIGVALSVQEAETLPTDPWDVPLHAVITEQEWIVIA